ncbi:phosphatidylethanolamine N-methyltransferase [Aulographum hederae CBS 113979]|uniref:Phosphatidylethanolamine N-methyltransferase n=1 Tax=Aulographum hederae CBS 113979 TaxID=1176131 RepID=A0A6G1HCI3_9PEZI|nr:phosphatidylethanolamine N-methyltransferase [Aulographum hederae CBS 113979]
MNGAAEDGAAMEDFELRQRPSQLSSLPRRNTAEAKAEVQALNKEEDKKSGRDGDGKRTYGRTPAGTVFTVPHTHDMVSQLLSPTQPKNISDLFVLFVLGTLILTLYFLPSSLRVPIFAVIFLFWRACYNIGIGYLLHIQSHHRQLVKWAEKSKIFVNPKTGENPHPQIWKLLKREMETKIPVDYKFEEAPIEYNTWLVFRRVVDLILMCDFVSYCLFAIACGGSPADEGVAMTLARWAFGIVLFLFNLWVKLDAHRVVKDYAWYWGDFFFLIDQELTFDGVFEMAPHPMYSVGYAGYYGISLMAASYKVLFISIVAHAAQFAFLTMVENPHIEKTYNPPPPPKKRSEAKLEDSVEDLNATSQKDEPGHINGAPPLASTAQPSPVHQLLGFNNIDLHRVTDLAVLVIQFYVFAFAFLTPNTAFFQALFVINAFVWRLWYSVGMGYILDSQSNKKKWTRHFLKYGESTEEAWRQWKGVYHFSMTMFYASFIAASWKMYALPPDWAYGMAILRHVIGAAAISLHLWTVISIYESLGEFGWFFGDFFFDQAPKLTYSGIYRFLNNPERVLGLAGVWGFAIITWSKAIFFLALVSHILTLAFIQFVERPHMQKLYGQSLRETSGLSRSIKRSLPRPIQSWSGSVDRYLDSGLGILDDFIDAARPKLAAGVGHFVKDTTALFKNYPARISITRLAPDLAGYNPRDYALEIEGTPTSSTAELDKRSGREGEGARSPSVQREGFRSLIFEYGAPIKVRWTAPPNHSPRDWVGLYMVSDNASRDVTRVSSQGRWVATTPGVYSNELAERGILVATHPATLNEDGEEKECRQGEMVFEGDKLWWTTGVFEFRYHHDGKHNVLAISLPFENRIPRFDEEDAEVDKAGGLRTAVEKALLPVVQNCFDRDPDFAPGTAEEGFGGLVEREGRFAKRVVFAVHQMFGIEFAPEVVQADGNVKNLAWRICNAKKVLAPYSMSPAKGNTTPSGSKF